MICKECGAYNPDHATYCKVCAANLKENTETENESSVNDSRATRTFIRPSWTVPAYAKASSDSKSSASKYNNDDEAVNSVSQNNEDLPEDNLFDDPEEDVSSDYSEEVNTTEDEETESVKIVSKTNKKKDRNENPVYEEDDPQDFDDTEESDNEDDDEEEEFVPVFHRSKSNKRPPVRLTDEDEDESNDEYDDEYDDDTSDDSYEYEPTPPKRKSKNKNNGPLFWILLAAIVVVILCIIVAGVLMFLRSGSNDSLNCGGAEQPSSQQQDVVPNNKTSSDDTTGNNESTTPSDEVVITESINDNGEECINFSNVIVPPHGVVTLVLSQGEQKYTSEYDVPVQYNLQVQKKAYYPNIPLTESEYTVTPEIYVTETDGTTTNLKVPSFTLNFPTLTIDLQKPIANDDGIIMADKNNLVAISGLVDDFDVTVNINDQPVTVYEGGLFMYDYNMTETEPQTVTIYAEKANYVSTTTSFTVNPYVYTPDKMVLTVSNDPITGVKADKSGKLTINGLTLPNASLTASSNAPSRVVCGSVAVDDAGNFNFQITMDSSFYGVSAITLNAEKEGAETGSTSFYVYRSYSDRQAFLKGYNAGKKYKEIGSGSKNVSYSALLANIATYASAEYGFRATAKVAEIVTAEDGYSYVRMTLVSTGETIYVLNLSEKWDPASNIGSTYNVYGNFLGTYLDGTSPLFAGFFAVNKS